MYVCTTENKTDMKSINLKRIIEVSGIKPTYLGRQLFPHHKHPYRALDYVRNGKNNLDSWQVAKLAEVLNVPVGLLFEEADWGMSVPAGGARRIIQFKAYDYFAELDLETMTTTVSRSGELVFQKVTHPRGVTITDYLSSLTDLIIKNKN